MVLNSAKNYFHLFDLPVGFVVDTGLLAERYRALLRAAREEDDQAGDLIDSSSVALALMRIDEAHRVLADPQSRAEYLLDLYADDQAMDRDTGEPPGNGGALLMEQMELRAILAEAANRPDAATAVAEVLTQLAEKGAALDKELQDLFADPSPRNLCAAREILRQLQFLGRCRRDAENRSALLPG